MANVRLTLGLDLRTQEQPDDERLERTLRIVFSVIMVISAVILLAEGGYYLGCGKYSPALGAGVIAGGIVALVMAELARPEDVTLRNLAKKIFQEGE